MLTLVDLPGTLNKIMVFGLPGSGKSTFATKLARRLGLPIYHLDKHFYVENWIERDYQEFLDVQQSFVNQSRWVIDGNAMKSLEIRFQKADVAIYFHYSVFVCLWRILKRVFHKNWHIPDLAEGCTKSIRFRLIKYMFQYHRRYGPKMSELRQKYPHVCFYIFESDKDAESFFNTMQQHKSETNELGKAGDN
jgi:adenylate kinase family enzyme